MRPMRLPRQIISYGHSALLLNWEQRIAPDISASVHAYAEEISRHPGVTACIPAYASLLVRFSPAKTTAYALREFIFSQQPTRDKKPEIQHELPVCYDPSLAPDLLTAAATLQLYPEQLIGLHLEGDYLVYQIGFRPGFAFLGETDEGLNIARRQNPRKSVPAGSVGLAGRQTGIYPSASPGGWQLIGRCPWPMIGEGEDLSRLHAGDRVRFRSVSLDEFHELKNKPAPWPIRSR